MTTIYFIRHAEPERSVDSIYTGRTYPLTQKGLADRELVTAFLMDKSIDVVLSSPYKRAVDTIADFAEKTGHKIELIEDFRERAVAETWLGLDEWKKFAKKQWDDFDYKQPNGESIAEVQKRNLAALQDVLHRYDGKNIVIGAHGMALSSIIHHYSNSGFDRCLPRQKSAASGGFFVAGKYLCQTELLYDSGFDYSRLEAMPMPWVAKMVFDNGTCFDMAGIDLFNADKKTDRDNMRVTTAELNALKAYRYTVIFARYNGKWLYCRHKERDVFETAGGGIEPGETPPEGAARELIEETGAIKFDIRPAFDTRFIPIWALRTVKSSMRIYTSSAHWNLKCRKCAVSILSLTKCASHKFYLCYLNK